MSAGVARHVPRRAPRRADRVPPPSPRPPRAVVCRARHDRLDRAASASGRVCSLGSCPNECGLICDVGSGDGPVIALRADIDALAMDDEKDVPYRSQRAGVAHACGHDVHTTVVLGAGLALAEHLAETSGGRVRLMFEPAEESLPGGSVEVIDAGGLDEVAAIFGLHCDPKVDVGHGGRARRCAHLGHRHGDARAARPGWPHGPPASHGRSRSGRGPGRDRSPDAVRARLADTGDSLLVFGALHRGRRRERHPLTRRAARYVPHTRASGVGAGRVLGA